jgi:hypothetical protein
MSYFICIECDDDSKIPDLIDRYHLDKRYRYTRYADRLVTTVWYTTTCSGCTEMYDTGQVIGSWGCSECGYTGKRRNPYPMDITRQNILKKYRP